MIRGKIKYYEPNQREKESEKINDIYKLISHQEQTMAQLLEKYQDTKDNQEDRYVIGRTIQVKSLRQNVSGRRGRSANKIQHIPLQLPSISPMRYPVKGKKRLRKSKDKLSDFNPYSIEGKDKNHLKNHLQKAYGTEIVKRNRSRSRIQSIQKHSNTSKKVTQQRPLTINQPIKPKQFHQNGLPTPIGYLRQNKEDDSSSEQAEIPLAYYQRQFRTKIRQQCLQQTNFLYFSKNESMKDWTESLLLLFQKHDKELHSLRKKCKYLQKFDDNFFSIDIFKQD